VNIRVIATTNRSLYHEVTQGRFREDLFYRLNVFPVTVPPLRDRLGDIPLLARHFLRSSAQRNGLTMPTLSERAIADLQRRPWKGNVRELENVMERAILVATGGAVDVAHLMPGDGTVPVREVEAADALVTPSTHGSLWEMERDLIFKTLTRVKENRTHAAKELGISIRTLRNKLREYRDLGYQVAAEKS
jgi:two-component system response regulator FlrC